MVDTLEGLPSGSICKTCANRITRLMKELDEEGENYIIEHGCDITLSDLSLFIVTECSHWKMKNLLGGI